MQGGDSAAASKQQQEGQQQTGEQEVETHVHGASLGSHRTAVAGIGLHGDPV